MSRHRQIVREQAGSQWRQHGDPSYSEQLNQLKSDFEEKLKNQKKAYEQEIKERDNVIRQLMTSEADNSMQSSRLNEINKRRNYTKW